MDYHREKIDQLHDKIEKIEALLTKIISNGGISCVNIEQLDIKGPILEYKFDEIDVDEVSGSLNLGINLGVPVDGLEETINIQPKDSLKKATTPSTEGNKNSTSKGTDDDHKAKFPDIEKKIDEKLKEMFPKASTKQGQKPSTNNNTTENKDIKQMNPSTEKQLTSQHDPHLPSKPQKATYSPTNSKERFTTHMEKGISKTYKRKRNLKNVEEVNGVNHRMTKSSTGFSYKFTDD